MGLKFNRGATGMNSNQSPGLESSISTEAVVQSKNSSKDVNTTNGSPNVNSTMTTKNSVDMFHDFEFGLHKILTTIGKINSDDIEAFFVKLSEKEPDEIEKVLPKNSKLLVFCGYHGILDTKERNSSKMGTETDKGFFNDIKTSLMNAEEKQKFKDLNIKLSGDMRQVSVMIGKTMKQSVKEVTDTIFEDLQPGKRPRILFLASCFSQFRYHSYIT